MSFQEMKLNDVMIEALQKQNITKPTKVQELVYGTIMEHKDMIVQSETGSGKTLAYLLPMFEKYKEMKKTNCVIVLVPTQELAMQVHKQVEQLATNSGLDVKSVVVFGNVKVERQIEKLKVKPQIIIGTAARIHELIKKKKINAQTVKTIIMDEADKLLDRKNIDFTKEVIKCTMRDRQLLFFSASIDNKTVTLAKEMSKEPVVVTAAKERKVPKNIEHLYIVVEYRDKLEALRKLVRAQKTNKGMIFQNGAFEIEDAVDKLRYHDYKIECIHGAVDKRARQKAVEDFRKGKVNYLVATDIAARGLHFDGVDIVFHLSIPEEPMDYLHRAGRTGRNGVQGTSILIVTKQELHRVKAYEKSLHIKLQEVKLEQGKVVKKA